MLLNAMIFRSWFNSERHFSEAVRRYQAYGGHTVCGVFALDFNASLWLQAASEIKTNCGTFRNPKGYNPGSGGAFKGECDYMLVQRFLRDGETGFIYVKAFPELVKWQPNLAAIGQPPRERIRLVQWCPNFAAIGQAPGKRNSLGKWRPILAATGQAPGERIRLVWWCTILVATFYFTCYFTFY